MSLPTSLSTLELWDEALLTGIPTVDQQHRDIARLGAKMLKETGLPLTSERFGDYFAEFWQLVADHFETEEELMRTLGFPKDQVDVHTREHSALLERLIQTNIHSTTVSEWKHVSDIAHELIAIIVDHIIHFDLSLKSATTP
ncbi:MAG: hemerythrin family protein [Dechloromonas sp.]|nr:hemerythrin family protein [Dechloromonas sp.]